MIGLARNLRDWVRDSRRRRLLYGALFILLALLSVFPRQYVARTKMLPDDNSGSELVSIFSALGGRMQNFASLFGDRGTVEVALSIARSEGITDEVIRAQRLVGPRARYRSMHQAQVDLGRKVDVHSLTGGMLEVEVRSHHPDEALMLTRSYLAAISARIGDYGRQQTDRKRRIVDQRMAESTLRLATAETALNAFKRENRLAEPQAELGGQLALRTNLEGLLQAKLVELQSARQVSGAENPALHALEAQVATLRGQISQSVQSPSGPAGPTAVGLSSIALQYAKLYRDYTFAQAIYEVYARSAEEVAVEAQVAESAREVAVIDEPHIDPKRYYNAPALGLFGLLIVLIAFTEIYAPATGIFDRTRDPAPV